MNKANAVSVQTDAVHPMKKSYMFISSKHVDYDNLNTIEAASMSLALVLAVFIGVAGSVNWF